MADIPIYWVGIAIWIAGVFLYFYPEDLPPVRRVGSGLCWIGLIVTAVSWFARDGHSLGQTFTQASVKVWGFFFSG